MICKVVEGSEAAWLFHASSLVISMRVDILAGILWYEELRCGLELIGIGLSDRNGGGVGGGRAELFNGKSLVGLAAREDRYPRLVGMAEVVGVREGKEEDVGFIICLVVFARSSKIHSAVVGNQMVV
jgi:hypothetical protein